jgi:DNA topoisomerase-3
MRLIVAEKPSMGRALAEALGIPGRGRSFIEGRGVIVTWCVGHLVEALAPEGYDPALKSWRWDSLPLDPGTFRYAPIDQTKDQYEAVARLLNRDDVTDVVNATDAGREGELIFDLVYRLSGCTKPVLRFWASSLTPEAIQEAYAAMKPGEAYAGLRDAARSRQEADWLVGLNATRAQTLRMRRTAPEAKGAEGVWSVGRVQTPTLALLVRRELELRDFKPQPFWTLRATFQHPNGTYDGKWFRELEGQVEERFKTPEEAKALAEKLAGKPGKIRSATSKTEKKKPELLYDLTTLQKEANKRFGFTAERTLELAQELYERQLLSYPRTNSRHLTKADAAKAPGWIKALANGVLGGPLKPHLDDLRGRWPVSLDKRFVDDAQVEDHHALVPTEKAATALDGDHLRLYELVARRFLAAYFPERIEAKTTIITEVEGETFKTNGSVLKQAGWSEVDPPPRRKKAEAKEEAEEAEDDEHEAEGGLPAVKKGEAVTLSDLAPKEGKTTPPKRMSEADLLAAMQGAGKELDDDDLRGAMKDRGLGTPATRASIIETLLRRGYAERKRHVLVPTDKGIRLIQGLPVEALCSAELTGSWEARMERMRRGEESRDEFMADIRAFVRQLVADLKEAPAPLATGKACGTCGKPMRVIPSTQRGEFFLRCSDCGITEKN